MTERPWCLHAICTESKTGRSLSLSLSLYLSLALSRLLSLSGSLARSLSLSALIFGVSYEARISCAHRQLDAAWAARGATWRPVAGRTSAGLPTRRGPLEDMAALLCPAHNCLASALPSYAAPHPTAVCAPLLCTRSEHVPISDVFGPCAQWYPKTAQTRSEHVPNTVRTRGGETVRARLLVEAPPSWRTSTRCVCAGRWALLHCSGVQCTRQTACGHALVGFHRALCVGRTVLDG